MFDIAVTQTLENKTLTQVLAMSLGGSLGDIAMKEIWKPIDGHVGYEISSIGNVRSYRNRFGNKVKLLKLSIANGYKAVGLMSNDKKIYKKYYVHRLVAQAFIKNKLNKPFINHKNSNRSDNRIENLEWCTPAENVRFRIPQSGYSSKYKGVFWKEKYKRWIAGICFNGKAIHIGNFKNEIEAAKAYDKKAKELFGNFAYPNFKNL